MFSKANYRTGIKIDAVTTCDFSKLDSVSNDEVLKRAHGDKNNERLIRFIADKMGIENRYFVRKETDALDIARDAIKALIAKDPKIVDEAEFFILAGISNPMPTVCQAALLAGEFGFKQVSCWDIKSGCSTGVLGLMQALDWFQHGAKRGVMVCTETFSKFTHPETLQMASSIGDGACALSLSGSDDWKVLGAVHGSDPVHLKTMYVPGKYPIDIEKYNAGDYVFHFENKSDTLETLAHYWQKSLGDLLKASGLTGAEVTHYVSHQVDGTKNRMIALGAGIPEKSIAQNFAKFGNMGCPTVFINYAHKIADQNYQFKKNDTLIFHAVGGGLTWAGVALKKVQ